MTYQALLMAFRPYACFTPRLDKLSVLQSYIDFEINSQERLRARELYERLLERTSHVKVWLSYASFEAESLPIDEDEDEEQQALASTSGAESPSNREAKARRYELLV